MENLIRGYDIQRDRSEVVTVANSYSRWSRDSADDSALRMSGGTPRRTMSCVAGGRFG